VIELKARQIPNLITLMRIVLVLPTTWLLWEARYVEGMILMSIAGASDALDGWLSRRFSWGSRFGAAMDPVADKLLVAAMFIVFTLQGHIEIWLTAIVLARDVLILTGAATYRLLFETIEFAPTFISKANTAMQIVTVLLILLALCQFPYLSEVAELLVDPYCFYILAVLGVSSGLDYALTWGQRAWRHRRYRS
jgi:cardiolipin synthase